MTVRTTQIINRKALIPLLAFTCCILFVTLIYRETGLGRQILPVPFWSFREWIGGSLDTGFHVVLNILLFMPFGYLLASLFGGRMGLSVLLSLACSLLVETAQYLSCRGVFDADDLITNTLGGALGAAAWFLFRKLGGTRFADAAFFRYALIAVGIAGCLYNVKLDSDSAGTVYESQFAFSVDELRRSGGELIFSGDCYIYIGTTPAYTLFLQDDRGEIPVQTGISGGHYSAKVKANAESKYEIFVRFQRHKPVSTKFFLHGDVLEYVSGDLPGKPSYLPGGAVLKAVNEEHGVQIWQDGRTLYWVISGKIPPGTELVCHLSTNEPEKLPEGRRASHFDSIGCFADKAGEHEMMGSDGCRVFSFTLPDTYPVTAVMVGYAMGGRVTWEEHFRP